MSPGGQATVSLVGSIDHNPKYEYQQGDNNILCGVTFCFRLQRLLTLGR